MKWHKERVDIPIFTPDEFYELPEDDKDRIQFLKRKLAQYINVVNTLKKRHNPEEYQKTRSKRHK